MDERIDAADVTRRLEEALSEGNRLVFWEDDAGDYADALGEIRPAGATVVDATHHELATKRLVLRGEPRGRFVIYRAGGAPDPVDDLVLDLKLEARPFTCTMEGSWAEECGVPLELAQVVSDHAAFFRSKERRQALAATSLPKETAGELRFAMCAATLRAADSEPRDAARSMATRAILEWSRGDEAAMRAISAAGLAPAFWDAMRAHLGYAPARPEDASVGDMAFRMLEGMCGDTVEDAGKADPAESARVLGGMARGRQTRPAFDVVVREYADDVADAIPQEGRTPELLADVDAIPQVDEWILGHFLQAELGSGLDLAQLEGVWARRRYMLFADRYSHHYEALLALARFSRALDGYRGTVGDADGLPGLLSAYAERWHEVDRRYRELLLARDGMRPGRFREDLEPAVDGVEKDYADFLEDLTDRWQSHLMDEGTWPPPSARSQDGLFHELVELSFPEARPGRRVGVIVSDALRYEAGRELSERLSASGATGLSGKVSVSCGAAVCMLPSYTQLGMAALLPDGPMRIDPASCLVEKSGRPTQGRANRQVALASRVPGAVALGAEGLLDAGSADLGDAPLSVVYHNVIDKTGDSRDSEGRTFEAVETACTEIERLVQVLVRAGCGKVFVTSDHGFLYQRPEPESYAYADVPGLAQALSAQGESARTRRFAVGRGLPRDESLLVYGAGQLSLEGDYEVAMPRGITRLRLQGSGARFVHGGASPQEDVIPVVTVEVAASRTEADSPTGVEGFPTGRTVITGPSVSLVVYQTRPCGAGVTPLAVRVGAYADDGTLLCAHERELELSSDSGDPEQRKTRVTLRLTDEVDAHATAWVRISARVGATTRYRTAWEREYSVNRAFGSDF